MQTMTPRKAIYTPEEAKARAYAQNAQWQKENTTTVNIRMSPEDKAVFAAYAEYKGQAIARMFRQCAEACMRADGWTYQPEAGKEGKADQAEEQAQQ